MDGLIDMPPEEDPENMPSATEELLQIMEDFADVIDKFMFEIVTFLAVVDSAMGLVKDVLGLFGFAGWKLAFFPTFSFIVTTGVFIFGAKKRKGKRDSDVPEGLADAFEAIEDVMEVVEDVAEGLEEMEAMEAEGGAADGDLGNVLGDVVGSSVNLPIGEMGDLQGTGDGTGEGQGDANTSNTPADGNQNMTRKVIAVAVLAAGIIARLKKKRSGGQEEDVQSKEATAVGEGTSKDVQNEEAGIGQGTPQGISQRGESQPGKTPPIAGVSTLPADHRKPLASTTCGFNESVIIDLNVADRGKRFVETDWQNTAKTSVISAERQLRWNTRQLKRGVEHSASDLKHGIERVSLQETGIAIEESVISAEHQLRWNTRQLARGVEQGSSEIKHGIEDRIKHGIERVPLKETSIAIEDSSTDIRPLDENSGQTSEKQLNINPIDMASGVVKNTTDMAGLAAGSAASTAGSAASAAKKSGSMLHIAIRLARLAVRVVNKKKGGSSSASQKSEESTEKGASTSDVKVGSTESEEAKANTEFPPIYTQYKYLMSTSTQTELDNAQSQYRSEPQYLNQASVGMLALSPRHSPWDTMRRSVVSMPDTTLMEMRDAAMEEIRYRGKPSEDMKTTTDTVALRPAWLGSRDEMAGRQSKDVSRDETLLPLASPHSRLDEPGPRQDEYSRTPGSHHLDAPVIVNRAKDTQPPNTRKSEESGVLVSLHEREKGQSVPEGFQDGHRPDLDEESYAKAGSSGRGPPAVWDRGKDARERNVRSQYGAPKGQRAPDGQGGEGPDLDVASYGKPGSSGRGALDVWDRHGGRDPRVRNIRSSSSYEGLEEDHEERSRRDPHYRAKSSQRPDVNGSQRSIDCKPRNIRYSVSYEDPEEDSVFEEEARYHDGDWRSERSSSNTRLAPNSNRGKYTKNFPPSKSGHSGRLTSFDEDGVEDPYSPHRSATHSPNPPGVYQISESSGSMESSRSQRRSNMSLSSVRFADEEPNEGDRHGRGSRNSSNRQKGIDNYLSQQRDSRRKIAPNARWNSAVCLTGHQKAKMSVSSRDPYPNDNYISDETGSPRVRQGSRTRINRGPSFNRLSRGPSTMSRTQSASYLGDDESDVRA
ncbi:hypothetical protein OS493_018015 [Desmophyllum pertusum]|uniref:Uncharacterized protein n=1 Tax=Desmophyllum pertusum TaxID=174260 RepID=A0A9W9Z0F1_9CNID|nr:hypothetical protein OS493_018015 [Desmophyllum pertusum]